MQYSRTRTAFEKQGTHPTQNVGSSSARQMRTQSTATRLLYTWCSISPHPITVRMHHISSSPHVPSQVAYYPAPRAQNNRTSYSYESSVVVVVGCQQDCSYSQFLRLAYTWTVASSYQTTSKTKKHLQSILPQAINQAAQANRLSQSGLKGGMSPSPRRHRGRPSMLIQTQPCSRRSCSSLPRTSSPLPPAAVNILNIYMLGCRRLGTAP